MIFTISLFAIVLCVYHHSGSGPIPAAEQLRISRRRGARRLGKRSTKGDTSKRGFVTMSISIGTSSLWSDIATTSSILSTSRIEFHSWRQAYDEERFPVRPRDKRSRKSRETTLIFFALLPRRAERNIGVVAYQNFSWRLPLCTSSGGREECLSSARVLLGRLGCSCAAMRPELIAN